MSEQWKDVTGYKGSYQVSDLGRVRSLDRVMPHKRNGANRYKGRLLKLCTTVRGYKALNICGKLCMVHTLVAREFIGPRPEGCEVCHGSAGSKINSSYNLYYGTHKENGLDRRRDGTHGGKAVVRSDGAEFINMVVAAEETGCNKSCISAVCRGKRQTAKGFGWKYA
jgi:hypothetical protein